MDVRPYSMIWRALSIGSFGMIWVVGLLVGRRWKTSNPFVEMISLLLLSLLIIVAWSVFGTGAFMARIDVETVGFIFVGALFAFFMIWASTFRSFWGVTLPCCVAGSAAAVGIMFVWAQGNAYRAVEGTLGGAVLLTWMLLGLYVVRRRFGVVVRESNLDAHVKPGIRKDSQLSLNQVLLLVGSCCLLFAVVRFIEPGEFLGVRNAYLFVAWLMAFVGVMSATTIGAFLVAFRVERFALSGIVFLLTAGLVAGVHYFLTRNWDVDLLWGVSTRYSLVAASGSLVWVASRYCQAKGYKLESPTRKPFPET